MTEGLSAEPGLDDGSGQLRPGSGEYADALCSLPSCGQPLSITWTLSRAVFLSDTAAEIGDRRDPYTVTWQVGCLAGHVVLVPPDTGEDVQVFGMCPFGDDDDHEPASCVKRDMDRLRAVIAP